MSAAIGSIAAYVFTVDERLVLFLLLVNALVALAVTVMGMRGRRILEVVAAYLLVWAALVVLTSLFVHFGLDRPFLVLEVVSLTR
jgi:purine-cytosine permease-like protein